MHSWARGAVCRTIAPAPSGAESGTSARTAKLGRSSSRATTTGNTGARNMSEQPCHVGCYAFATGREVNAGLSTRQFLLGLVREQVATTWWIEDNIPVPDLYDPRWLAETLVGVTERHG